MSSIPAQDEIYEYINQKKIEKLLEETKNIDKKEVEDIIEKALTLEGLTPREAAILLQVEDQELINKFLKCLISEGLYSYR